MLIFLPSFSKHHACLILEKYLKQTFIISPIFNEFEKVSNISARETQYHKISVFMVAIKLRSYQIKKNDQNSKLGDLESNLLNFIIIALIILHGVLQGYNQKK